MRGGRARPSGRTAVITPPATTGPTSLTKDPLMTADLPGVPTHHTRVERWECDFNDHWNTRFHMAAIQAAAEVVALRAGIEPVPFALRHVRFHHELRTGAGVTVRSARVAAGDFAGATVHWLTSGGRICTTALDRPGTGAAGLPPAPPAGLALALPRGLTAPAPDMDPGAALLELGPLRPHDFDHAGHVLPEVLTARSAMAATELWVRAGMGEGPGRMAVESRFVRLGACRPGQRLMATARLLGLGDKSVTLSTRLMTAADAPVVQADHVLLCVDLQTRRAIAVPEDLRRAARSLMGQP